MTRDEWESATAAALCDLLEIANGDAQDIIEAAPFEVAQAWGRAETPDVAARRIAGEPA